MIETHQGGTKFEGLQKVNRPIFQPYFKNCSHHDHFSHIILHVSFFGFKCIIHIMLLMSDLL